MGGYGIFTLGEVLKRITKEQFKKEKLSKEKGEFSFKLRGTHVRKRMNQKLTYGGGEMR